MYNQHSNKKKKNPHSFHILETRKKLITSKIILLITILIRVFLALTVANPCGKRVHRPSKTKSPLRFRGL